MNQQPSWFALQQPPYSSKMSLPRTFGRVTLKITLFFIGALIAELSLLGGTGEAAGANSAIACFIFPAGIIALIGSIFVFFNKGYYLHCLPKLQYLYWLLGATLAFLVLFVTVFSVSHPETNPIASAVAAGILTLYGISFIWIAHMKPTIAQQINESVYRIVKRIPEKQIVVSDLLARLQKTYKWEGSTLYQYLGTLEYVELVNIPGAPGLICRMKPQTQGIVVAPMTPSPVNISHAQVALTPPPSQVPAKQIVATPPSLTNLHPEETNRPLADLATIPVLPTIATPKQTPLPSPVQQAVQPDSKPVGAITPLPVQNVVPPSVQPINAVTPIQHVIPPDPKPVDIVTLPSNQAALPVLSVSHNSKPSSSSVKEQKTIQIFCCYAHEDEQLLDKLKTHLQPQQRQGLIHIWHDRDIGAGAEWEQEIEEQINTAQIILLLISADFMASDYCYTKEMQRVLERHARGEVHAIPIILRPTDWKITPLGRLQALPKDGKPITTWPNRENAYLDVATGIRTVVETFFATPQQSQKQVKPLNNVQRADAEVELIRARCTQGKLIITNKKIAIELASFGKVIRSQILLRSSLTSIDTKLAVPSVFGMGGGMNLTFHGKGKEILKAELVPPKEAQEILALLS